MNCTDISHIWLTDKEIMVELKNGKRSSEFFKDYPRLANSTKEKRDNYVLSRFGIHWPDLDEDLSFDGFFNK